MPKEDELEQAKEIGQIKAEVHTLNTLVTKLFEKFDAFVEKIQPKQIGIGAIIGIVASGMGIFALLFSTVIYITNSANGPLVTQMTQMAQVMSSMQANMIQYSNQGQLLSRDMSGIEKSVKNNEDTLQWIIFQENIPKQVTETQGRLNTLEMQMQRVVNQIHTKGK